MKRFLSIAFVAGAFVGLTGCDDVLSEVQPFDAVSSEVALTSQAGFEAVLVSLYDRLQGTGSYGQEFILEPDALADNATVTSVNSNRYDSEAAFALRSNLGGWGGNYAAINEANNILATIDNQDIEISDADRARIKGEALFMRALNYFDLMRVYAYEPGQEANNFDLGVILRTEPTFQVDDADFRARATNDEVYAQIIADLQQAATLLEPTSNPARVDETAAQALLSRVYLYAGQWDNAETAATNALATAPDLVEDDGSGQYLGTWLAPGPHPEAIFELQMTTGTDGAATNTNGSLDALTNAHAENIAFQAFSFEVIPTADLLDAYEADDARLDLFAAGQKAGGEDVIYIRKYTGTEGPNVDNIPILRTPELYLNRAEAYAEQGQFAEARDDLNEVRNARNLPDVDASLTGQALIDAILQERRVEFAFEGHRFFDLKRRGLDIPKPQAPIGLVEYGSIRTLAPIPEQEVENSGGLLVQNPFYSES